MMNINFKHSLIFFNLCILLSPFYFLINYEPIILCLFLILFLGISHGSLDNIKGAKLMKLLGYKSIFIFYTFYLLISLFIILSWTLLPNAILLLFLIIGAYHFGREDAIEQIKSNFFFPEILYFLKGSSVIIAPLYFKREQTIEIFQILNFNVFENILFSDYFLIIFLILSFLSSILLSSKRNINFKSLMIIDFFSIIILNYFLTPVLAFTLYFCFLHSIRHSISLIFELDKTFKVGLKKFIKKAIPLTVITATMFIFAIYILDNFYRLDEAIYKVIFIGLASLTFPHILLEYLLEKNEKRA